MAERRGMLTLEGLQSAVESGEIETVVTAFTDLYGSTITDSIRLVEAICQIFLVGLDLSKSKDKDNLERIRDNAVAQRFYIMFLQWRLKGMSYGEMIARFLAQWERSGQDLIYVGTTWGELTRNGHNRLWVDLSKKSHAQKVNLAIGKIKEEQDFLDFKLMPFIEVLKDLGLVDKQFYDQIKFGASDLRLISLLQNGLSLELSRLLLESYTKLLNIDPEKGTVSYDAGLLEAMRANDENPILIFEAQSHA